MEPVPTLRAERAQAQIEVVAGIPILLAIGAVVLQLLALGYAQSLADGAAEAGAVAAADGRETEGAALAALPGWARSRIEVGASAGEVRVALRPPALLPGLGSHLEVSSSAFVWTGAGR